MFKKTLIIIGCLMSFFPAQGMKKEGQAESAPSYAIKITFETQDEKGGKAQQEKRFPVRLRTIKRFTQLLRVLRDEEFESFKTQEKGPDGNPLVVLNATPFLQGVIHKIGLENVLNAIGSLIRCIEGREFNIDSRAMQLRMIILADALQASVAVMKLLCFFLFLDLNFNDYSDLLDGHGIFVDMNNILPPGVLDTFFMMPFMRGLRDAQMRGRLFSTGGGFLATLLDGKLLFLDRDSRILQRVNWLRLGQDQVLMPEEGRGICVVEKGEIKWCPRGSFADDPFVIWQSPTRIVKGETVAHGVDTGKFYVGIYDVERGKGKKSALKKIGMISGRSIASWRHMIAIKKDKTNIVELWNCSEKIPAHVLSIDQGSGVAVVQVLPNGLIESDIAREVVRVTFVSPEGTLVTREMQGQYMGGIGDKIFVRHMPERGLIDMLIFPFSRDPVHFYADEFIDGFGNFVFLRMRHPSADWQGKMELREDSTDLFIAERLTFLQRVVMNALLLVSRNQSLFARIQQANGRLLFLENQDILDALVALPESCIRMLMARYSQKFIESIVAAKLRQLELEFVRTKNIKNPDFFIHLGGLISMLRLPVEHPLVQLSIKLQEFLDRQKK